MLGTVIHYDRLAAYGFILPDDQTLPDFFVIPKFMDEDKAHRFLCVGWRVSFDPVDADTAKPQAHHVRIVAKTIARQVSDPAVKA
jgi:cold shock CspA family protein